MGFWDWLSDALSGGSGRESNTKPVRERNAVFLFSSDGDPVAVLEEPASADVEPQAVDRWWAPEGATLTEPVTLERPELSTEARVLENLLVSQLDGHDLSLPPLPRVPERVLRHLRHPKCNFVKIADEISADQVIATAVLRMANSPLYRELEKVTSLQPAVSRLGSRALRTLMMHQSLRAANFALGKGKGKDNQLANVSWARSLAGACVMSSLSRFTKVNEDDAFLLGLLHDIGNVIVLRVMRSQEPIVRYDIDAETFDYLCHECHQEFGELIADAWGLPSEVKALISDHHTPPGPDDPLRTERLQLQLTDMINALLGYAPYASYDLLATRTVRDLGLADSECFVALLAELPERIEETITSHW